MENVARRGLYRKDRCRLGTGMLLRSAWFDPGSSSVDVHSHETPAGIFREDDLSAIVPPPRVRSTVDGDLYVLTGPTGTVRQRSAGALGFQSAEIGRYQMQQI